MILSVVAVGKSLLPDFAEMFGVRIGITVVLMLIILVMFMYVIKMKYDPPKDDSTHSAYSSKPKKVRFGADRVKEYTIGSPPRANTETPRATEQYTPKELYPIVVRLAKEHYEKIYENRMNPTKADCLSNKKWRVYFDYYSMEGTLDGRDNRIFTLKDTPTGIQIDQMSDFSPPDARTPETN